jgi:hypothetical protein
MRRKLSSLDGSELLNQIFFPSAEKVAKKSKKYIKFG